LRRRRGEKRRWIEGRERERKKGRKEKEKKTFLTAVGTAFLRVTASIPSSARAEAVARQWPPAARAQTPAATAMPASEAPRGETVKVDDGEGSGEDDGGGGNNDGEDGDDVGDPELESELVEVSAPLAARAAMSRSTRASAWGIERGERRCGGDALGGAEKRKRRVIFLLLLLLLRHSSLFFFLRVFRELSKKTLSALSPSLFSLPPRSTLPAKPPRRPHGASSSQL